MIADTGLLVALERDDRQAWFLLRAARERGQRPIAPAGVLAQAWRGGPRQARLAIALRAIDIDDMTRATAAEIGGLLGDHHADDVIDGHVALLARQRPHLAVASADRADLVALGVERRRIIDV